MQRAQGHMKGCSASLAITEMQIKTTMRHHFTLVRMAIITKSTNNKCAVVSHVAPTGDLAYNPGMGPDWESNWQPFVLQPTLNPLSHTSQGRKRLS